MNANTELGRIEVITTPSTPEPSHSEAKLNATAHAAGITPDGTDWLSYVLDPFKDSERDAKGFPDMVQSRSVIQIVPQTISIGAPTSVTGTWDANVTLSPQVSSVTMLNFPASPSRNILNTNYAAPTTRTFGGLEIRSAAAGTALTPSTITNNVPLPASYFPQGNIRVIGMAMEIHNTTADINKQGSVCVYRDQAPSVDSSFSGFYASVGVATAAFANFGSVELQQTPTVPESLASARILGNAKQWEAEKGCYVVATLANDRNRPLAADTLQVMPVMYDEAGNVWSIPNLTTLLYTTGPSISSPNPTNPPLFTPFNLSGAYFTGLSNQTTLTIDVKWIVEKFPNHDNTNLVVLAKKSPMFDPLALEMYARIADALPAGVPVCENAIGDWIETIADLASDVGIPFAGPISKGVKFLKPAINALAGNNWDAEKIPQRNRKKPIMLNMPSKQLKSKQIGLVKTKNNNSPVGSAPRSSRGSVASPVLKVTNSNRKKT
jgi:hypothetical protein